MREGSNYWLDRSKKHTVDTLAWFIAYVLQLWLVRTYSSWFVDSRVGLVHSVLVFGICALMILSIAEAFIGTWKELKKGEESDV